ncbi:MAG TPA: thiamine phosphate synthase [Bryobacteraceae bacterium]|nr:thiamine phosphate synthase [Bryobacteraceae bacterium]
MKPVPDWRLYLVTDRALAHPRPLEEIVRAAVRGGVTAVQLREKRCGIREFVVLARALKAGLPAGVPLIINDRVDVALAAGADGVHLGQSDLDYDDARRLLGPDRFIGLSVETMEQALAAECLDVDYLGVSPIFSTPTKTDTGGAWGIEGLRLLRAQSRHRLIAIGGLNQGNAREVVGAGADGIAVVSAVCAAPEPESAARELRRIIDGGLRSSVPLL